MIPARRRFVAATLAAPFAFATAARAQARVHRIGYLSGGAPRPEELVKPLAALGYVEGRNLAYDTRIVDIAKPDLMHLGAEELVRRKPDLLIAYQTDRVEALAAATTTIPIVAGITADPVGQGLAKTLRRPGRNVTGLSMGMPERSRMQVALLKAARPRLERVAFIHRVGTKSPRDAWELAARPIRAAAGEAGAAFLKVPITGAADVDAGFRALGDPRLAGAIPGPQLPIEGRELFDIAIRRRIAMIGDVDEGALFHFDLDFADGNQSLAAMIDKILRGMDPAEIPFEVPDRTEITLNRATAKAIGVTFGTDLLLRASRIVG